jgi:hypothetical protein
LGELRSATAVCICLRRFPEKLSLRSGLGSQIVQMVDEFVEFGLLLGRE